MADIHNSQTWWSAVKPDAATDALWEKEIAREHASMINTPDLSAALDRAKRFRQSWNADDVLDDDSGLTGADLDVLIAHVEATKDHVAIRVLGDLSELG